MKEENNKKEKEKHDNLSDSEKEQLGKYVKKGKKVTCDSFEDDKKKQVTKNNKKRTMDKHFR